MPADLIDSSVFTEPVTVPEPGDDRTAASVEGAFQALANRTRSLKDTLDNIGAPARSWSGIQTFVSGAELSEGAEIEYSPPRPRVFPFGPAMGSPGLLGMAFITAFGGPGITFGSSPATWHWEIVLPVGARITALRCLAQLGTNPGTAGFTATVYPHSADGVPSAGVELADLSLVGPGDQLFAVSGLNYEFQQRDVCRVNFTVPTNADTHQVTLRTLLVYAEIVRASGP